MAGKRCVPPTSLGAVNAALGDPAAAALTALENAVTVRDTRVIDLKDDPHWTVLHKVARLVALLRKLRLDRYRAGLSTIQARWVGALKAEFLEEMQRVVRQVMLVELVVPRALEGRRARLLFPVKTMLRIHFMQQ